MVLEPARSSFPITGTIHLFSGDSRPRRTSVDSGRWNTELIHLPRVLLSVLFWAIQPPKLGGNPWKGGILIFTTHLSGPIKCSQILKTVQMGCFLSKQHLMPPVSGTHNTYSKLAILSVPPPHQPPAKQRFLDSCHNYNMRTRSVNNYHTLLGRLSQILECDQLILSTCCY